MNEAQPRMNGNPYRNPALTVELGQRVLQWLMTQEDWAELLDRFFDEGGEDQ